jgi:hypothetical protein
MRAVRKEDRRVGATMRALKEGGRGRAEAEQGR